MLKLAKKETNIVLHFGYTYEEINIEEGSLIFKDSIQKFRWLLGCDGINSPIREKMMETGKFKYERIEDENAFIETRVQVPSGINPACQHTFPIPNCILMCTPLSEGYKKDPVEL